MTNKREEARKWIEQLKTIVFSKELDDRRRVESMLRHIHDVREKFPEHLELHDRYGLDFKLKPHNWMRRLGTFGKIILGSVSLGSFIVMAVRFLLEI